MSSETEPVKRMRQTSGEERGGREEAEAKVSGCRVCCGGSLRDVLCCHQAPLAPSVLAGLDQRWRNWWIRGVLSVVMISFFVVIVYLGPIALSLLVSPRPLFLVCVCVCSYMYAHVRRSLVYC